MNENADEIVKALRCCGNTDTKKPDCEHCPLLSTRMCVKVMLEGAADLIVRLNDFDKSQSKIMLERCQRAEAQLAESQRREKTAVEDIEKMMRVCEKGSCHFCANGDCTESPYCTPKWRGPQEAQDAAN